MKALLAFAAVVVTMATASTALAAYGPGFITENSASQNRLGHAPTAALPSFVTENSASQNRVNRLNGVPGYRFITENSASQNRLNPPASIVAPAGFRWGDAGIGASAMFGAVLIVLGGAVLVVRRRDRVSLTG